VQLPVDDIAKIYSDIILKMDPVNTNTTILNNIC